jgi:hypothetical protein
MFEQPIEEFMHPSRIINSSGSFDLSYEAITRGEAGSMPIPMDATQIQSFDSFQAEREPLIIRDIESNRPGHPLAAPTLRTTSFLAYLWDWAIANMRWGLTWEWSSLRLRRINFPSQS